MKLLILILTMLTSGAAFAADGGFLFVTFNSEATPMSEQIYFGLSKDGLNWEALNNTKPVLVSTVGEKAFAIPISSVRTTERNFICWPPIYPSTSIAIGTAPPMRVVNRS